ncbi:hypothetical protein ACVWZ8_000518 [Arthrobacter sp. UYCu723]
MKCCVTGHSDELPLGLRDRMVRGEQFLPVAFLEHAGHGDVQRHQGHALGSDAHGPAVRLEQELIHWDWALERLRPQLPTPSAKTPAAPPGAGPLKPPAGLSAAPAGENRLR